MAIPLLRLSHEKDATHCAPFKWWFVTYTYLSYALFLTATKPALAEVSWYHYKHLDAVQLANRGRFRYEHRFWKFLLPERARRYDNTCICSYNFRFVYVCDVCICSRMLACLCTYAPVSVCHFFAEKNISSINPLSMKFFDICHCIFSLYLSSRSDHFP